MTSLIIAITLLVGLPLFLLFIFRASSGIMFLAACAGIVLLDSLDPAVVTTAGAVVPLKDAESYIRLFVVLLSVIFAAMLFKGSVRSSQLGHGAFLAIILGATLWLLLPSASGVSWLLDGTKEDMWQNVNEYKTLVIATGFSLSLLDIMIMRRGGAKHGGKKHKKEH